MPLAYTYLIIYEAISIKVHNRIPSSEDTWPVNPDEFVVLYIHEVCTYVTYVLFDQNLSTHDFRRTEIKVFIGDNFKEQFYFD